MPTVPPGAYYLRPLDEVRLDVLDAAIDARVPTAGRTIVDVAADLVRKGVDLRKVWYRLPEEIDRYGDEPATPPFATPEEHKK